MPRVPTNQRMNANLKEVAKLLEWEEIKYIPKYDHYEKLVSVEEHALKNIFSTKFMRKNRSYDRQSPRSAHKNVNETHGTQNISYRLFDYFRQNFGKSGLKVITEYIL